MVLHDVHSYLAIQMWYKEEKVEEENSSGYKNREPATIRDLWFYITLGTFQDDNLRLF